MNTAVVADSAFDHSLYGKFYMHEIKSDYEYIRKDAAISHVHDFIEFLYNKTNSIVKNYLYYSCSNLQQFEKYKIGHGFFIGNLELSIRHRIILLLKEYYKDGVIKYIYDERKDKRATLIMKYLDDRLTMEDLKENILNKNKNNKSTLKQLVLKLQTVKLIGIMGL